MTCIAAGLGSPLLDFLGPLGSVLQDMEGMGDMAAAGEMAGAAAEGAMDTATAMEAMAAPAMTMSFLLPGIGLGLLKGILLGNSNKALRSRDNINQQILLTTGINRCSMDSFKFLQSILGKPSSKKSPELSGIFPTLVKPPPPRI